MDKDLSDHVEEFDNRPVFKELDEAGYQYVADEGKYWMMRHSEDKPVIYYDPATDTALPMLIVEQFETYMNN